MTDGPQGSFVLIEFSRGGNGAESCANLSAINDLKLYEGLLSLR